MKNNKSKEKKVLGLLFIVSVISMGTITHTIRGAGNDANTGEPKALLTNRLHKLDVAIPSSKPQTVLMSAAAGGLTWCGWQMIKEAPKAVRTVRGGGSVFTASVLRDLAILGALGYGAYWLMGDQYMAGIHIKRAQKEIDGYKAIVTDMQKTIKQMHDEQGDQKAKVAIIISKFGELERAIPKLFDQNSALEKYVRAQAVQVGLAEQAAKSSGVSVLVQDDSKQAKQITTLQAVVAEMQEDIRQLQLAEVQRNLNDNPGEDWLQEKAEKLAQGAARFEAKYLGDKQDQEEFAKPARKTWGLHIRNPFSSHKKQAGVRSDEV